MNDFLKIANVIDKNSENKIKQRITHSLPDGCLIGGFDIFSSTGELIEKVTGDLNEVTIEELEKLALVKGTALKRKRKPYFA